MTAAGFYSGLASAQALGINGNPVEQLPAPPAGLNQSGRAIINIAPPPTLEQPAPGRTVTPVRFDIEGVQSIPFGEVAALFQPFVGQPTSVVKLTDVARQVTAAYQRAGYVLSFAFLPQQDFGGGVVRVVAVEGYVANIRYEGDAGKAEPKVRELAERIRQDRPLTRASFERYTQLIAQLPGVKMDARALPPTQTDGAGAMVIKVSHQPYSLSLDTDVRTAVPRAVLTGVLNDPFTPGSRLSASTLVGGLRGESFLAGSYSQVVGAEGLTLKGDLSQYRGNPDAQLSTPPAIRRSTTYERAELSASYPVTLHQGSSFYIRGGAYAVNNADDYVNPLNGGQLTDRVKVRALYAQATYNEVNATQSRNLTARLVQGLKAAGASSVISTNLVGPLPFNPAKLDFTRVSIEGNQRNVWDKTWGTVASLGLQYSPHKLPSFERISFGSTRFGRAYSAGAIAGDSGWGIGLEGNRSFVVDMKYLNKIEPYILLERARVYSRLGVGSFSRFASASLGLRVSDGGYYTVDIAASKPLGDAAPDNPNRKVRLSTLISYNFGRK